MLRSKLALLALVVLSVGLIGNAYAHKSVVAGDYKIEVGWKKEPPIVGKPNSIEIMVTKASPTDKAQGKMKMDHSKMKMDNKTKLHDKDTKKDMHGHKPTAGISGLSKKLQVDISLGGNKTFLKITEDKKMPGHYLATFTPDKTGSPLVHVFGKIGKTDVEVTVHPEKVEDKSVSQKK